jgi:sugar lactone lactonase YvrE
MDASGNMFIADVFNNVIRKINTSGIISTIAGNGIAGYWGDGGMATMAELYYPTSIAADDSGNIFIADEDNNRIRKVNSNGIITTVAGNGKGAYSGDGGLATAASINFPGAVTIDRMNNIYIADSYNGRIRMVNNKGIITTIAGNGKTGYSGDNDLATLAEFNNPVGISIDTAGNLYIGDSFNYRVRKLTKFERELGNSNGSVNIFPNPNHGVFNINTESLKVTSQIEIFNILGQQIFYTNINPNSQTEIDLSHESPGIYIYQVIVTGNVIISRGRIVIL